MISEIFVYVMLPGRTSFITAGRFELAPDQLGNPLGRFIYGRRYLERTDAVELDPVDLKLVTQTFETRSLKGLFGALRDASPDYWGRRIIEKHAGIVGLGELDYLLQSPDDRAGALGFGLSLEPPAPQRQFNRTIELERLQALADTLMREELDPDNRDRLQTQDLLLLGTSMGGARPKATVEDQAGLWLAKFSRPDDRWNQTRVEHAMLQLARECNLRVAESRITRVGMRDVLLVRRFDREQTESGYQRARMLSALTLLRAGDSHLDRDRWSYLFLVEELRRLCKDPRGDARELFKRMVFNALISNTDDHPRNHAVIAPGAAWQLSPAYDLTPMPHLSMERRELAMTAGDLGRHASAQNFLSQCARFLLSPEEATKLIEDMETIVRARWHEVARREGVSERDCETLSRCFVYDGFRYKI